MIHRKHCIGSTGGVRCEGAEWFEFSGTFLINHSL